MIAARLHRPHEALSLDEIPVPRPGDREVLVKVEAAGICGSDLHIIDGETLLPTFPRTLGHEVAGTIAGLGSEVRRLREGDRVCIDFLVNCGDCEFCRKGRESLCRIRSGLGVEVDGGFAEYVAAPARNVIPVPDCIPPDQAAVTTDALATPYHAISKRAQVRPGEGVAVIGLGGLGTQALQLLRLYGAQPIVGIDPDPASRERARRQGATRTFDPTGAEFADWAAEAPSSRSVKTVFDFHGSPHTVRQAIEIVDRGGRVVVVGLSRAPLQVVDGAAFVREEVEVVGSYAFERQEIVELLRLLELGLLDVSEAISHRLELAQINDAISRLRSRAGGPARIVVYPGSARPGELGRASR